MTKKLKFLSAILIAITIMVTGCEKIVPHLFSPELSGDTKFTNQSKLVFSWVAVENAVSYQYKIGDGEWVATTETTVSVDSAASGTYSVMVKALYITEEGETKESLPATFTIVVDRDAPLSPTITSPTITNDSTPVWSWSVPAGADLFQYSLDGGAWIEVSYAVTQFTPATILLEGTHTLALKAGDKARNWSAEVTSSTLIDLTAPNVPSVISTSGTSTNSLRPGWQWVPVSDVYSYRYQLDFEIEDRWEVVDPSIKSYSPDYDLMDGDHILYVQSQDAQDNWSASGSRVITIDTQAPTVPTVGGDSLIGTFSPQWSWDIPATTVGFKWKIEGQGDYADLPGINVTSMIKDVEALGDGDYTFMLLAYDQLGNESAPGSFMTTVFTAAGDQPVVTFPEALKQADQYYSANIFPEINWALASGDEPFAFRWSVDGGSEWVIVNGSVHKVVLDQALSEGAVTAEVQSQATDGGVWSVSGEAIINIDLTAPGAPTVNGPMVTGNLRPSWSWVPDSGETAVGYRFRLNGGYWITPVDILSTPENECIAVQYQVPSDLEGNDDGIYYTFEVQSIDGVGNWSVAGSKTTEINTSTLDAPLVTCISGAIPARPEWSWTIPAEAVLVRYKLGSEPLDTDPTHEISVTSFIPSSELQVLGGTSTHTLYVQIKNGSDVWSGSGLASITIDREAPAAPFVYGPDVSGEKRPTWEWQAEDPLDAAAFAWKLDADTGSPAVLTDGWNEVSADVKLMIPSFDLLDGKRTLYVRTADSLGNWSISGSHEIDLDTTALPAPVVTVAADLTLGDDKYVSDKKPAFTWVHSGAVTAYRYRLNGGSWVTQLDETITTFNPIFNLSEGDNLCEIQVQNIVGNWSDSGICEVLLDSTPPSPPVVTSVSPETSDVTPTWTWSTVEPSEVVGYQYRLGVAPVLDWVVVDSSVNNFVPLTDLPEGQYTLEVKAQDIMGLWSVSGSFIVTVNSTSINYGIPQPIVIKGVSQGALSQGVRIEWVKDPEATSYTVHRLTQSQFDSGSYTGTVLASDISPGSVEVCGVDGDNLYYYDISVNPGEVYYYRLKGKNPDGEGELSIFKAEDNIGMALGSYAGQAVSVLVQSAGYRVNWPACTGAVGYYLYRSSVDPVAYTNADWGDAVAYEVGTAHMDNPSDANLEQDERWYRVLPAVDVLVGADSGLTLTDDGAAYENEISLITGYSPKVGYSDFSEYDSDYTVPVPSFTVTPIASQNGYIPGTSTNFVGAPQGRIRLSGNMTDASGLGKLNVRLIRTCHYGKEEGVYPLSEPNYNGGVTNFTGTKKATEVVNVVEYSLNGAFDGSGVLTWDDPMPAFDENGSIEGTHVWTYAAWDREAWKDVKRNNPFDMDASVKVHYKIIVERTCQADWGAVETSVFDGWPELTNYEFAQLASWLREIAFNRLWMVQIPRWNWDNTVSVLMGGVNQNAKGEYNRYSGAPGDVKAGYIELTGNTSSGSGKGVDYSDWPGFLLSTKKEGSDAIAPMSLSISISSSDDPQAFSFYIKIISPLYDGYLYGLNVTVRDYGWQWGLWPDKTAFSGSRVADNGDIEIHYRGRTHTFEDATSISPISTGDGQSVGNIVFDNNPYGYEPFDHTDLGFTPAPYTRFSYKYRPQPENNGPWSDHAGDGWLMTYGLNF